MKRFTSVIVSLLVIGVILSGCSSSSKSKRGIFSIGDNTCYKIYLQDEDIADYFTLTSPSGKVSISGSSIAEYSAIEEGGWIAYYGKWVFYIPSSVKQETVQTACGNFYKINSDDYLTVAEAAEYLPWLGA